jgi:hypothetical protein
MLEHAPSFDDFIVLSFRRYGVFSRFTTHTLALTHPYLFFSSSIHKKSKVATVAYVIWMDTTGRHARLNIRGVQNV